MASTAESSNDNFDYISGLCFVCKRLCTIFCSRCGEFYCSLQCQRDDWKNHRLVCFKMPFLMMGPSIESTNDNVQGSNPYLYNKTNEKFNNGNRSIEGSLSSTSSTSSLTMRNQSEPKKMDFGDPPKNNEDVVLIWVSENSYYIRTCRSSSDYENNKKAFHQHGLNANELQHIPKKNDIVLVRWNEHFVRGLVLSSYNNKHIHVALFDIGGTTHKPLSYLREISDELSERKRFNFKIGLDIGSIKAKECQKLLSFVREKTVFRLEFDGDTFAPGINVKLFEKASGSALDKLLRSPSTYAVTTEPEPEPSPQTTHLETKKPSKLTSPSQQVAKHTTSAQFLQPKESVKLTASVEPQKHLEKEERQEASEVIPNPKLTTATNTFITDLTLETLPEDVADILVLDTSTISVGCISVIELKNVSELNQLHARIKDIVKDLSEEYDPENNEMCLVKFTDDGEWYRAEYIAEYDTFCFIDYGNYASVERKDVRKLPLSLRDPCYTVLCYIDNFTALSIEGTIELKEFLLQNQIHKGCNVKKKRGEEDEEEVHVTLDVITKFLKL